MRDRSPRHRTLPGARRWRDASGTAHLVLSLLAGALAGVVATALGGPAIGALVGWTVAAAVFLLWTWTAIWPMDGRDTAAHAQREDPSRVVRDVILLVAAVGATVTVALVIFRAHQSGPLRLTLGVACIAGSWLILHTVLTLRYARLYYTDSRGGIDFKQTADPAFRDFAYVAFTVGMTFQISDNDVTDPRVRSTVLGHALMSFVFATVIIAVTVNLVAGLGR